MSNEQINIWKEKLQRARGDKEIEFCKKRIAELELKIFSNITKQESIDNPEIKIFLTQFGLVTWNKTEKTIDCEGAIFTENELLNLHSVGDNLSPFELELKRKLPSMTFAPEMNTAYLHIQREWKGF